MQVEAHCELQQNPSTQIPPVQSALPLQSLPLGHLFGQPPPQSMSLSDPSLTPSVQLMHLAPEQTLLVQSALPLQVFPSRHLFGQVPPQSTSLSLPF